MAKNDLRIDILGTNFTISTDEEPEYLEKLLTKFRQTVENVKQRTGLTDPLKIAVLTGFLLSDDLEKAGIAKEALKNKEQGEAEQLTLGMISRLSETLSADMTPNDRKQPSADPAAETAALPATPPGPPVTPLSSSAPPEPAANTSPPEEVTVTPPAAASPPVKTAVFRLQNTVKHYTWGSPEWIPALMRKKNISRIPWAELWMGVHPAGPSLVEIPGENETGGSETGENGPVENGTLLSELIEKDREAFLGKRIAAQYGALPFLFKVLAAAKPLSIQVHPNLDQAGEGFNRENLQGIPLDAPDRNYRDSNQKSEVICALSPFAALCGFRETGETSFLIEILSQGSEGALKAAFEKLLSALKQEDVPPHKAFLSALFCLDDEVRQSLDSFVKERKEQLEKDFPEYKGEWGLCVYLASLFPGDPGIIAPLYLNIIELAPGEAMYLPSGVFHSYIKGLGIELMTDSDNVLRGGLTSKHIDPEELLTVLDFGEFKPEIIKAPSPATYWFKYPFKIKEFSLAVIYGVGSPAPYLETGPSILIVTEGSAGIINSETEVILKTGDSCFIPPGNDLELSGDFTAYIATAVVPPAAASAGAKIP